MSREAPAPIYESVFIQELVKQMRALDTYGVQDKSTHEALIKPFLISKEERKKIPIVGDPSPTILTRVTAFYSAVSMVIEMECGLMARPILNISHEGFGTMLIIVGKLVAVDKVLRDIHRFGFVDIGALKHESDTLLNVALGRIGTYPDVAGL
ncbi:MAG: NifX-associated nitrogen fixation protein [Nitrospirae bacterium]|nr:NifX-associated nitrogen fixation protein [Magnetococcales bacterium]HAT49255.1 NifX-associated nitrogen fixation protein [Alphaproteobacteria bacterium]